MEYRSIINHPENGEMLNLTESAKYLGVSRRKFRRIAPKPDHIQDGVYPFWSRRVLDILSVCEDFDHEKILKRGKACGNYLIAAMDEEETKKLRIAMSSALLGGGIRNHTCGIEKATQGMSELDAVRWAWEHCDCPCTTFEEKTAFALVEYGIKIKFHSSLGAQVFRDGILSAIKDYFKDTRIS